MSYAETGYTPLFQISAGGVDFTTQIKQRLVRIEIHELVGITSDTVEIELDDRDGSVSTPGFGAQLQISIGYKETGLVSKGVWIVDELECDSPPQRMIIRARSADSPGNVVPELKQLKTKSWLDPTTGLPLKIGVIASNIADAAGLGLKIDGAIAAAYPITEQQTNQSDLWYLNYIVTSQPDGFVKVANMVIICGREGTGESISGAAMAAISVTPNDCLAWRSLFTRRASHKKVTARWTDPNGTTNFETTESDDPEDTDTEYPEDTPNFIFAKNTAQSEANAYARNEDSISMTLYGLPQVSSGVMFNLSGFRGDVDGSWWCNSSIHRYDENGYVTEVECAGS